jgi:hypothetical protein
MFELRFQAGDVHRPYSSLRADPLGTKVLYDSLAELKAITVERNHQRLDRLAADESRTILFLGVRHLSGFGIGDELVEACESAARNGSRVILSLYPRNRNGRGARDGDVGDKNRNKRGDAPEPQGGDDELSEEEDSDEAKVFMEDLLVGVNKRWHLDVKDEAIQDDVLAVLSPAFRIMDLPESLSCHTSAYFDDLGPDWRDVYSRDGKAVVIERAMGRGSLVLFALSYAFSNEAMRNERHSGLLSWCVGRGTRVVFDEYHHGIVARPGIGSLLRDYSLHWVVGALLLLGVLFVWRNSLSLVPPVTDAGDARRPPNLGRDVASGLANLLRRNVSDKEVLAVCLDEWMKSAEALSPGSMQEMDRIREMVALEEQKTTEQRDYVRTYNDIVELLKRRYRDGTAGAGASGKNGTGLKSRR